MTYQPKHYRNPDHLPWADLEIDTAFRNAYAPIQSLTMVDMGGGYKEKCVRDAAIAMKQLANLLRVPLE